MADTQETGGTGAQLGGAGGISASQRLRLDVLALVQYDTAAAKQAIAEIADDPLKLELFKRQYTLAQSEPTAVSRTTKALQGMKEALPLFE
ncbi:hypothetical protein C3369_07310 [Escherichia sp. ESNIH1]|uniref:DUF2560 family protein n=1 Tax=Escherichia sp. ESNIH1 TaxID=1985876 RepID=UPI000CDD9C78|nr:DUF2560 family protein [Escherichia sp. ESNIH1]POU03618.1 hypothetical protein C3369_07310 [Escherichia sp. ESNIH1]